MKTSKTIRSLGLTGIAALALAMMTLTQPVHAGPVATVLQLTNSSLPTVYAQQGGTNSVTVTNAQTIFSPSTGSAIYIGNLQNVPVWWDVSAYAADAGTSNLVVGIDLSPFNDPSVGPWVTNTLQNTLALKGTGTNLVHTYYALSNGTNVFSGYQWARWSYATTAQTNSVHVLNNQFTVFR